MRILSFAKRKEGSIRVQAQVVGHTRWLQVGRGRQGPIEVTFHQPQRTDKTLALDETTGETIFVRSQQAEKKSGNFHAVDFPKLSPGEVRKKIDVANVSGGQVQNIRGSSRENWPIGEKRDPEFTLKKLALGGFKTNLGDRYQRRLKALDRLKKKRDDAKKRNIQESNNGIPF